MGVKINPQDTLAWNDKGIALYAQGKFDEVLQVLLLLIF
jgi:Flp pilus assembly protein TadD